MSGAPRIIPPKEAPKTANSWSLAQELATLREKIAEQSAEIDRLAAERDRLENDWRIEARIHLSITQALSDLLDKLGAPEDVEGSVESVNWLGREIERLRPATIAGVQS